MYAAQAHEGLSEQRTVIVLLLLAEVGISKKQTLSRLPTFITPLHDTHNTTVLLVTASCEGMYTYT